MSVTDFGRDKDCWKAGEYPEEFRNPVDHEYELNLGSNAPGVEND